MTKISKRIAQWLLAIVMAICVGFGIAFTLPQKTASAAEPVEVTWSSFNYESNVDGTAYTRLRFNTPALAWTAAFNDRTDDCYLEYTKLNGRTVKEINEASNDAEKMVVKLQPAGSFSFYSVYIPNSFTELSAADIYSVSIEPGWSHVDSGTGNTYTSKGVRYDLLGGSWRLITEFVNLQVQLLAPL